MVGRNKGSTTAQNPTHALGSRKAGYHRREITGVTVTELETDHREGCLFLQLACGYSFVCHYPVGFLTNETEQLGRQLFPRLPDSL